MVPKWCPFGVPAFRILGSAVSLAPRSTHLGNLARSYELPNFLKTGTLTNLSAAE